MTISMVPNADGAIVLEWKRGHVEMSAAIEAHNGLFLCSDNTATDDLLESQTEYDEALLLRFLEAGSMK